MVPAGLIRATEGGAPGRASPSPEVWLPRLSSGLNPDAFTTGPHILDSWTCGSVTAIDPPRASALGLVHAPTDSPEVRRVALGFDEPGSALHALAPARFEAHKRSTACALTSSSRCPSRASSCARYRRHHGRSSFLTITSTTISSSRSTAPRPSSRHSPLAGACW